MVSIDIILECFRAIILLVLVGYLLYLGKKKNFIVTSGWKFIQYGFLLILFGSFLDITDNFTSLNSYIIVGDTETEAFLEKVVGYLAGFIFLTIGLMRWGPTVEKMMNEVTERKEAEIALLAHHDSLEQEIIVRKQAEMQAHELLQQNRELTQALFQTQEKERRYLASELHDEFGQWLTAVQLNANNIANLSQECEPLIHESAKIIDEAAVHMHKGLHRLVQVLKPTLLDEIGLRESIKGLISQWQYQHKSICCELDIDEHLDDLGGSLPITVYRLIQESLTNISKHADASNVSIKIHRKNGDEATRDTLLVTIEDNGKGISHESPVTGFGISGMRERVISEGGQFTLNEGASGGLCIHAQLQINQ